MSYALATTIRRPFAERLATTRDSLAEQGFRMLSKIDMQGHAEGKAGRRVPPQVILGACRPPLAYAALQSEPSAGPLLPCNVVIRALDEFPNISERS